MEKSAAADKARSDNCHDDDKQKLKLLLELVRFNL